MRYIRVLPLMLLGLAASCGTVDERIDPDANDPVGGAVLQSQDIRTMADQMARDIVSFGVLRSSDQGERIRFHITELRNDSSDTIDKELILTELRTQLFQSLGGQVAILDRSKEGLEAVRAERAAKRAAAVDANPNRAGSVLGSDYVLKGTIKERVQQSRDLKSVYYVVTFELTDLETSELRWTNSYQAKFLSEKSVISR
jgi:hypothetical protein